MKIVIDPTQAAATIAWCPYQSKVCVQIETPEGVYRNWPISRFLVAGGLDNVEGPSILKVRAAAEWMKANPRETAEMICAAESEGFRSLKIVIDPTQANLSTYQLENGEVISLARGTKVQWVPFYSREDEGDNPVRNGTIQNITVQPSGLLSATILTEGIEIDMPLEALGLFT